MSESMDMSPSSWTIVQRVKEIVNMSEAEIYATLKDCDMDPDEAVVRLTAQGSFLEVKRKREKKNKEVKVIKTAYRGSTKNGPSGGIRNVPDGRYLGRGSSTHYSTFEASSVPGKPTYGNGDGTAGYTSYVQAVSDVPGNNKSNGRYGHSNGVSAGNEQPSLGKADSMTSVVESTPVHQSSLTGAAGQLTMADVVKLGRTHSTISNGHDTHELSSHVSNIRSSDEDQANKFHHHGASSFQHVSANSDWPPLGKPADGQLISAQEHAVDPEMHPEEYVVPDDDSNQHYVEEMVQESEKDITENSETNDVGSNNHSLKKIPEKVSRGEELGDSVSVVTKDLRRLNLENNEIELPTDEDELSVIIPDHLQVQSADCSHLSFGRFQPAKSSTYSLGIETSAGIERGLEDGPCNKDDTSLADHANTRSLFYGNVAPEGIYDSNVASRHEEPKQYSFNSSIHDQSFDDSRSADAVLNQTSTNVQNHALLSNMLQSYGKPVSSSSLAANAQPRREPDPTHELYPTLRAMPAIYENALPMTGGSAISISEALKAAGRRPTQPPLPQHLDFQSLGPYADMIDGSSPQIYGYNPSGFNQTLARKSTHIQSLAAGFPLYKASVPASSLPYDASVASRRGGFGRTASIHGDYPMDGLPPSIPGRSLRYDDGSTYLNNYYRQLLSLQQNESSANWLHRHDSQAMPASSYHNRQRQIPQLGIGQQQSQEYIMPRYNYHYQNDSESPPDHQRYHGDF